MRQNSAMRAAGAARPETSAAELRATNEGFISESEEVLLSGAAEILSYLEEKGFNCLNLIIPQSVFDEESLIALADALDGNEKINSVKLSFQESVEDSSIERLFGVLNRKASVINLEISANRNSAFSMPLLIDFLRIDSFPDRSYGFSLEGTVGSLEKEFLESLRGKRVEYMHLQGTNLVPPSIYEMALNTGLLSLHITGSSSARLGTPHEKIISDETLLAIVEALNRRAWPLLSDLNLTQSGISSEGLNDIVVAALRNGALKNLDLSCNNLGDRGATIIAAAISGFPSSDLTINLNATNITAEGELVLRRAVNESGVKIMLNNEVIINPEFEEAAARAPSGTIEVLGKTAVESALKDKRRDKHCSVM